jgi:hypothetical protein
MLRNEEDGEVVTATDIVRMLPAELNTEPLAQASLSGFQDRRQ